MVLGVRVGATTRTSTLPPEKECLDPIREFSALMQSRFGNHVTAPHFQTLAQQCRTINANLKRNRFVSIRSLSKYHYHYRSTAWIMLFRIGGHAVTLQAEGPQIGIVTLISMCYTRFKHPRFSILLENVFMLDWHRRCARSSSPIE